jgi:hypothetical protein
MVQIIAEKDREIELARNSLSALYAQKVSDPIDPQPHQTSPTGPLVRQRSSAESIRSALASSFIDEDASGGFRSPIRRTTSNHYGESKNVFYEQELAKYEQEILELRNMIRLSEMKVRFLIQSNIFSYTACGFGTSQSYKRYAVSGDY